MKKTIKRTLPLLLAAVMLLSTATLGGLINLLTIDAHAAEYQVGDIVEFGSYPQTEVKDEATLNALNSQSLNWISYGYYSGNGETDFTELTMEESDYMKYADVTYNGTKYRAVKFTEYRPYYPTFSSSDSNSEQDDNGYKTNTTYWFKYEPLKWRVLDPNDGFLLSEAIIDSQAYRDIYFIDKDVYWGACYITENDRYYEDYANDYETSSIREWLNRHFYNTAFTFDQGTSIKITTLDNSAYTDEFSKYDSQATNDKVFLLSYDEALNTNYGFNSNPQDYDAAKLANISDYAKCQGLQSSSGNFAQWRLRSPGGVDHLVTEVLSPDLVHGQYATSAIYDTRKGIRPAIKVSNITTLRPAVANSGIEPTANSPLDNNNVIYIAIAAAVLGIVLGMVIMFIIVRKKNPSGENKTGKKSKLKTAAVDASGEQNCNIDFSEIVSFAPLTDEQLEPLNQKLNEQNTKTKFKNFKLK